MPSVQWNKGRWPPKLGSYRGPGHWGDHWGSGHDYARHVGGVKGLVVLEIGPGAGRITKYLLDAKLLILVDVSSEFPEYCLKRFAKTNTPIVGLTTTGHLMPQIKDKMVDFVVSEGVFVHLDRETVRGYISELRRVVKPGGIVMLSYYQPGDDHKPWFCYYESSEIEGWFRDSGFMVRKRIPRGRATILRVKKRGRRDKNT